MRLIKPDRKIFRLTRRLCRHAFNRGCQELTALIATDGGGVIQFWKRPL